MKICFMTYSLSKYHGYGRASLNLVRGLEKLGVGGPILTLTNSSIPGDLKQRTFAVLRHKPTSPFKNPWALFHDWWMIKKYSRGCQGIHFLTESHLAATIFRMSLSYIVTIYGTWALKPLKSHFASKFVFKRAYKNAKAVISISNYTQKNLQAYLPKSLCKTIYLAIDNSFSFKNIQWQKNNKNEIHILSVGALGPSKGYKVSVEAVARFAQKFKKPVVYTIVSGRSNSIFEKKLQKIADKFQFKNLHFQYQITDRLLKHFYKKADIFLLTPIEINGDFEGFGLIFLEAFAAKLPIVASRSGAVPETVEHDKTGLLVKENNVEETILALRELITNKKLRQKCIINGQKRLKNYSISKMAKNYYQIYKQAFTA